MRINFQSFSIIDLLSSLFIFVCVLWICELLVFGFVDLFVSIVFVLSNL